MNFMRMTALIAVTVTFFACERRKDKMGFSIPSVSENAITEYKAEEQKQHEFEGFRSDSTAKQKNPDDKQKQPTQQQGTPPIKQDWDKKIIKNASLNLEIKDYNTFSASLREKINAFGGYIAQEEQSQSDYKIENSITVKVPFDQFDNAVVQLTVNTEKINEKKITSQDVTTEFIDTKSRMESKKQIRLRYMDLLKQAKNMEEILNVQSEINEIQEQIESAAGRIEYLGHSSTFSTIHLTYFQILNYSAKDSDKPSFGTQLSNAFKTGWSWVGDLFIGLVSIWPLFLLIFTGIIIYKKTKLQKPKQA